MALVIGITGCFGMSLKPYEAEKPILDPMQYFNGPISAWGIVQDWKGNVVSRFEVEMHGSWENDVGTLDEEFRYSDGTTQRRVWTLRKLSEGHYEGSAGDIIGKAVGRTEGNAMRWTYQMDVPVKNNSYRLKFDDWMWLMKDGVLINRSYMKKFGVTVAELTIFMKKG